MQACRVTTLHKESLIHPSFSNTGQARLAGQTGKAGEPTGKGSQGHAAQK